jgi:translation initiation factor IF-3
MFRGREVTHPERGVMILDRLAEDLEDLAIVEQRPIQDGRNMTMMLGPSKAVLAGTVDEDEEAAALADGTAGEGAPAPEAHAPEPEAETGAPEAEEPEAPQAGDAA